VLVTGLSVAASASASSGHVALVRQNGVDPTIAEAIHRIRGELVAEGFDVSEVDASPEPPPGEGTMDGSGTLATIDLSVDRGTHVAELRVVDHLTNKIVIRRTLVEDADTPHTAEVLAVRAVELLRASLLELLLAADRPSSKTSASGDALRASQWAAQGLAAERESNWGIEIGACVIADFGGIPPAVLGVARVRRSLIGPFSVRVNVAGLGTQPRVEASAGSARVTEDVGLLEVLATPWPGAVFHPVASLGAGTLYASVDGQPNPPNVGRQSARWALAVDGGAGVETRIGRHFALSLEAHALFAQPSPVVEFLGAHVARAGEPSVLGSLSVMGWL
jgi:hypothetical protein